MIRIFRSMWTIALALLLLGLVGLWLVNQDSDPALVGIGSSLLAGTLVGVILLWLQRISEYRTRRATSLVRLAQPELQDLSTAIAVADECVRELEEKFLAREFEGFYRAWIERVASDTGWSTEKVENVHGNMLRSMPLASMAAESNGEASEIMRHKDSVRDLERTVAGILQGRDPEQEAYETLDGLKKRTTVLLRVLGIESSMDQ